MSLCAICVHRTTCGLVSFYEAKGEHIIKCPKRKPMTNADRIRAMTDEELAELLTAVAKKSAEKLCESLKTVEVDLSKCDFEILTKSHLSWLKSPVEVDNGT